VALTRDTRGLEQRPEVHALLKAFREHRRKT
jgi:hypothetical protein